MGMAPCSEKFELDTIAVAAGADKTVVAAKVPFAGTLASASLIPLAAITGHGTETRTMSIVNKGADGTGTTVVAQLALVAGNDLVAFDEKALVLSSTPANLVVAEGDVLAYVSVKTGSTGLADPGGLVTLKIARAE